MTYPDALQYLYGLQRLGIKLGLENIRRLLRALGHPERALRTVHVGGTNGKGSTAALLAAILRRRGSG
ncbi:MAG: bifunctional folylpolyglutamate synthase/dihydrofolate synthase, partial [Candidatus Methylomirabilales bacterium]